LYSVRIFAFISAVIVTGTESSTSSMPDVPSDDYNVL
jgi:hypothetical protein